MTISVVLLCVAIGVIVYLKRKMDSMEAQCQAEISAERKRAADAIEEAQRNAEQQIKAFKMRLEAERKDLEKKDEKALMIDTLLGLTKLGERMTSLEETTDLLVERQLNYYNATADVLASAASLVIGISEKMESNDDSSRCLDYFDVRDIKHKLDDIERKVDDIKSETNSIYYKVN